MKFIHIDIMDGHFVPNLSFGWNVIHALRRKHKLVFDVHLMIDNPKKYLFQFIDAGADYITVHLEGSTYNDLKWIFDRCKEREVGVGLAISPSSDINKIKPFKNEIDLLLIMSIEPGIGGQKFIDSTIDKIKMANKIKSDSNSKFLISVDGAIDDKTGEICKQAGVNILVSGRYIFDAPNRREAINKLML